MDTDVAAFLREISATLAAASEKSPYQAGPRDWLEGFYFGSQIALLLVAGAAAWFAKNQVRGINHQVEASARYARATLLLQLDERYEGPHCATARQRFREFRNLIKDGEKVSIDTNAQRAFTEKLDQFEKCQGEECRRTYAAFLELWGFFETVGKMVEDGALTTKDAYDLFGDAIIHLHAASMGHISNRDSRNKTIDPNGPPIFENFVSLANKVKKHKP